MLYKRMIYKLEGKQLKENICYWKILIQQIQLLAINDIAPSIVYENQRKAARDIIFEFVNNPKLLMTMAIGKTQSGKTGVMYACIQEYTSPKHTNNCVPVKNVYIITGYSSNEWKEQTKKRIPEIIRENVYHRQELKKFMESIRGKKNILVLMDEIQIACKNNQSIAKCFKECGLLDKQFLMENDIKLVEFSATPNGTLKDSELWGENSSIVKIYPGLNYKGCIDLRNKDRIRQCKNLCDSPDVLENIKEIQEELEGFYTFRYHFIRTKVGEEQDKTVTNFKNIFGDDVGYIYHDCKNENLLDKYLDEKSPDFVGSPTKHHFIFIKEMARCAKTYKKKYVGLWYERCVKNFNDDIVIQGLLGRATGYDDNGDSIIFTNEESIERYQQLWDKDFSDDVEWLSNSTTYSKKTKSKKTFNACITNGDIPILTEEEYLDVEMYDNESKGYTDFEELKEKMKEYLQDPKSKKPTNIITTKACNPRNEEGATEYYISSKVCGSKKKAMKSENRLFKDTYDKIGRGTNIDKNASSGKSWIVYPVYLNEKSKPDEVIWFGKCWKKK